MAFGLMWVKQSQTTHDWEWFESHLYIYGDDWGIVNMAVFHPHYRIILGLYSNI